MKIQSRSSREVKEGPGTRKSFFCGLILVLAVSGCATEKSKEEYDIKITIGKYNHAMIRAYKSLDFRPLGGVTTDEQLTRVNSFITSFLESGQIMEPELHSIDFKEITIEDDRATVGTSEDWTYMWLDYRTREVVVPLEEIHYEIIYHLLREDETWLVDKVEQV